MKHSLHAMGLLLGQSMHTILSTAAFSILGLVVLLVGSGGCATVASIQRSTAGYPPGTGFVTKTVMVDQQQRRYAVFIPRNYNPREKLPAIVFLHGQFEAGTDGQKQLTSGLAPVIARNPNAWPFVVIFPQSEKWWGGPGHDRLVMACLDQTQATLAIDPDRVILSGASFGGQGVWNIGANHPGRFAALVPFSAVSADLEPLRLIGIPIWCFHNGADPLVSARTARNFCQRIAQAGGNITYTQFPVLAHDSCRQACADTDLIAWMLLQHRLPGDAGNSTVFR